MSVTRKDPPVSGRQWQARVFNPRTGRRITQSFYTEVSARQWHDQMKREIDEGFGAFIGPSEPPLTLGAAFRQWWNGAQAGVIRAKGGATYKPSVLSQYASVWRTHLLVFGDVEVASLTRKQVQHLVDEMVASGCAPSTVRNVVTALRAVLRWCVREEFIAENPAREIELPSGETPRDRIVSAEEATRLVWALDDDFGPRRLAAEIYNLAFFCGLRRGELMGLRRCDVAPLSRRIWVRQSYDPRTQTFGKPKSKAGKRDVGIPQVAMPLVWSALNRREAPPGALLLAGQSGRPFNPAYIMDVARNVWGAEQFVGLHEARHTYASIMIDAGVNIKTISTWMGHASVAITLDRYGHLMPGAGDAALEQLDRYLG